MFYNHFKNLFDQSTPSRRLFTRNIILAWMFYLSSFASVKLKPENSLGLVFLVITLITTLININFIYLISKFKRAYMYYMLVGIGGLSALLVLYIGAFEMIGLNIRSLIVFWSLFILSALLSIWLNYNELDANLFVKNTIRKNSFYFWDIEFDIHAGTNNKNKFLANLVRNVMAPFAPVFGIMIARNLQGEQEWSIIGIMMLTIAVIISMGYSKFIALGFGLLKLQRKLEANIQIINLE